MTRVGWGALVCGLALVATGLAVGWPPFLALGAGLVITFLGAVAYVLRSPRLAIERVVEPPRVEKGRPAIAVVRATNLSRRALPPVPIEQRLGSRVFRAELPRLHKDEQSLRTYRLPTSRRGTYEVAPVEVPRADPFGLCRRARPSESPRSFPSTPGYWHCGPSRAGSRATWRGRRATCHRRAASRSIGSAST